MGVVSNALTNDVYPVSIDVPPRNWHMHSKDPEHHAIRGPVFIGSKYSCFITLEPNTSLKGYCTAFQHALKSLEITGILFS